MTFSFIQITDHHLCESEDARVKGFATAPALRAVMRHIAQHAARQADFIVSLGDLADPPTVAAYRTARRLLGLTQTAGTAPGPMAVSLEGLQGFPMYFLPGNHDDRDAFFQHLFLQTSALPLLNARFEHKGVQFICLDWGTDAYSQVFPETLDFLAQALRSDRPSVILTHHQVAPIGVPWLDDFIAPAMGRFWEIVHGKPVIGILSGHVHHTHEQLVAGIPVMTLRSTAFQFARTAEPILALQPPHYRFVTIHDGILTSRVFEEVL